MGKEFLKKRSVVVLCSFIITVGFLLTLPPKAISGGKTVTWNISLWGGPRAWTKPVEEWAADMGKKTNGRWKIKIHYGGVLAPPKEALDGIRAGMFEGAGICAAYTPGKIPLHRVSELPFIAPAKAGDIIQLVTELWKHPALRKELLQWDAIPLLPAGIGTYHLMGNKPIRTVDDLKGVRIRIGGDIAKVLEEFGAVPTLVPAPEVYESLQRGTVDLTGFPYSYAFGAYKIHEVSKYLNMPMTLGTMNCPFIGSKTAWDALPAEFKNYHMEWYVKAPKKWAEEYKKADDKWEPLFFKTLEVIEFPASERDKLVRKAETIYEEWAENREKEGLPGREILKYYIEKRKELTGR